MMDAAKTHSKVFDSCEIFLPDTYTAVYCSKLLQTVRVLMAEVGENTEEQ